MSNIIIDNNTNMKKFYKLHSASLSRHKVANYGELWKKLQTKGYKGLEIQVETVLTKSEKDNVFHAVFSTDSVDRHGEVVVQNWKLKNFKKNPVYLDSHNYESIEHIIGKVNKVKVKDNKLVGDIEFAVDSPKGQLANNLAAGGFLNASSVGFIPLKFDDKFEKILESELLEISAVSVPANPEANYDKKDVKSIKEKSNDDKIKEEEKEKKEKNIEPEKKEEPAVEEPVLKSSPVKIVSKAIKQEYDIKSKALGKILSAIQLVSKELKGRPNSQGGNTDVNAKINKAIKTLLKLKK